MARTDRGMRLVAIVSVAGAMSLLGAAPAFGATIDVTTIFDTVAPDGNCSLREAVIAANTNTASGPAGAQECRAGDPAPAVDVIELQNLSYTLSNAVDGALLINSDVTIQGQPGTKIDGLVQGQALTDRLVTITGLTTDVTIRHVELTGGRAKTGPTAGTAGAPGGAISQTGGTLTIEDCVFRDNRAGRGAIGGPPPVSGQPFGPGGLGGSGGAILMDSGTLTISSSTFTNNRAGTGGAGQPGSGMSQGGQGGNGGDGGAIFTNSSPSVTITGSTLTDNHAGPAGTPGAADAQPWTQGVGGVGGNGGATRLVGSAATIATTTIANNAAGGTQAGGNGGAGGGIDFEGSLVLTDSTVSGNAAGNGADGGGIGSRGGDGGGIRADGGLQLLRTTVSGNTAGDGGNRPDPNGTGPGGSGGGVRTTANGNKTIVNSTITGNSAGDAGPATGAVNAGAAGNGGGIAVAGNTSVVNTTIASNTVGAGTVFNFGGTGAPGTGGAIYGPATLRATITSANGTGSCAGGVVTNQGANIGFQDGSCPGAHVDPLLAVLADNGGPTQTRALAAGSPAVDGAGAVPCLATDQRGIARPQASACDIGAFERVPDPPPPNPGTGGNPGGLPQSPNPGSGGPPPPQNPGGAGNEPRPLLPTLGLRLRRQGLLAVLDRGYTLDFTTNKAGTALLEVFVQGSDAKGLKLVAARRVRVGRGTTRVTAPGSAKVTAKLTRKARAKFKSRKAVKILVLLTFTDVAGNTAQQPNSVTLKR